MLSAVSRSAIRARPLAFARPAIAAARPALVGGVRFSSDHPAETYEQFNDRYEAFIKQTGEMGDLFELQRALNNCFAYDLVPSVPVIKAALKAARQVNDYATAVRVLEGVKEKVENKGQYLIYLDELKDEIKELGITTKEELYNLKL